jgi:DNA-directed RNA polymerase specialized sigma24 family protein
MIFKTGESKAARKMGTTSYIFREPARESLATQENLAIFNDWFSRCRGLLHFVACRVVSSPEQAALAVENCWVTASRKRPRFDQEGAFRSWLVRVLIAEASAIRQDRNRFGASSRASSVPRGCPASGSQIPKYQEKLG